MKNLLLLSALGCLATAANAQYLPNSGFESWKETCGQSYQTSNSGSGDDPFGWTTRPGAEPADWNGSSVNQKVLMSASKELISKGSHNDGASVVMTNDFVGVFGIGSNAPAFVNFGTPWVYAIIDIPNCDGGVYGGTEFTFRPDAIRGSFKRTGGTGENAHIIAYLWQGTFTSKVPSVNGMTLDDVDRVIMGRSTEDVTQQGQLIASCDYAFATTENDDWQEIEVPLTYVEGQENAVPEKMNVILSSADYWTRSNIQKGSVLEADDVQFVYYHSLSALSYGEYTLNTDAAQTDFDFSSVLYDPSLLSYTVKGVGATAEAVYDEETALLTITVYGNDYSANPESKTTYRLQFQVPQPVVSDYTNDLTVSINNATSEPQSTTVQLIDEVDGSTSFQLKNFMFSGLPVGNILIPNVTVEGNHYTFDGTISITAGDDPNYSEGDWMGPALTLMAGGIPVKLDATVEDTKMSALIDIDLSAVLQQVIKVVLAETKTLTPETAIQSDASLKNYAFTRTFPAGWSTLCLPFAAAVEATVQQFTGAADNTLNFTKLASEDGNTPTLEPNVPYLVHFDAETDVTLYYGGTLDATPKEVAYGDFTFCGNYTPAFPMESLYGVADIDGTQKIVRGAQGSSLNASGAYFRVAGDQGAAAYAISFDGNKPTGITQATQGATGNTAVYNLQGVKVADSANNLPAGLYIANGRKFIVK